MAPLSNNGNGALELDHNPLDNPFDATNQHKSHSALRKRIPVEVNNHKDDSNQHKSFFVPKKEIRVGETSDFESVTSNQNKSHFVPGKEVNISNPTNDSNQIKSHFVQGKGIENSGAICFASSVAQILFRMDGIRESVLNLNSQDNSQITALKALFQSLQDPSTKVVTNHHGKFVPDQFPRGEQGDSEEFYTAWMAILESVMKSDLESQVLIQTRTNQTTTASDGKKESVISTGNDYIVKVPFPEVRISQTSPLNFSDMLSAPQGPFGDEALSKNTIRATRLASLPKYASFSLVRTIYVYPTGLVKIKTPVLISESLDLAPYLSDSFQSTKSTNYRLKMFVLHQGDAGGGHYVAYVRNSIDSWQLLNDEQVSNLTNDEALKAAQVASLHFYEQY